MFVIESQNLWCELFYDEYLTEEELVEGIESIYNYIKQNPKEVSQLFNRYTMKKNNYMAINLFNLGFEDKQR